MTMTPDPRLAIAQETLQILVALRDRLTSQLEPMHQEIQRMEKRCQEAGQEARKLDETLYEFRALIKRAKEEMTRIIAISIQEQVRLVGDNLGYARRTNDPGDIPDLEENRQTLVDNFHQLLWDLDDLEQLGEVKTQDIRRDAPVLDRALEQFGEAIQALREEFAEANARA